MQKINVTDGTEVLRANSNVRAAWLFGSAQTGEVRSGSDIDVGVLFQSRPTLTDLVDLAMALEDAYGYENVDLITLNDASAILRFEAILGKRIFYRDLEECSGFVSLTAREYEYTMAMIQRARGWKKLTGSIQN